LDIKVEYESILEQVNVLQQQIAAGAVGPGVQSKGNASQQQQLLRLQKQQNELKSMLHVSETTVREARSKMNVALEGLLDSEALLNRAVLLKRQQDRLSPLFILMARSKSGDYVETQLPTSCPLNVMVVSAALLMNGTFEQKYSFLLHLFFHSKSQVGVQSKGEI